MKRILFLCVFAAGFATLASAQKPVRKGIREGNKEYRQEKFTDAEVDYRRALEANARSVEAAYNLGNSLYKQGKAPESVEQYKAVMGNETNPAKLSEAWHNIGNAFLASSKDQQGNVNNEALKHSIEAYKNALRNNPKDDETRYNLALAQKLLEDSQNQDQNQDQQQQQQDQQQQDQNQKPEQQDQQPDQQQQNPNEMSRENAEQILDAMMQEEKSTQEKVKAQQMQQQKQRKKDKNW
jgi:hypothetical protein